jgi:hypothetical protein
MYERVQSVKNNEDTSEDRSKVPHLPLPLVISYVLSVAQTLTAL